MGKALVIKNANFADNALAKESFIDEIPCTGVALNKSALSINYKEDDTIVATVTPASTTDVLIWTSSDESVATIANGKIEAIGVGNATITAECGDFSASCAVTVTATVSGTRLAKYRLAGNGFVDGGNGTVYTNAGDHNGSIVSPIGDKLLFYSYPNQYPFVIPANATKIRITKGGSAVTIQRIALIDTGKTPSGVSDSCLLLKFLSESDMVNIGNNVYEVAIPTYEGYVVNGVAFCFSVSGTFADSDFEGIEISFLAE